MGYQASVQELQAGMDCFVKDQFDNIMHEATILLKKSNRRTKRSDCKAKREVFRNNPKTTFHSG